MILLGRVGQMLDLPGASFDAAFSLFGILLFPSINRTSVLTDSERHLLGELLDRFAAGD